MKRQHPKKKVFQSKEDLYAMCQKIKELEELRDYRKIHVILNDLLQKYPNDELVQYYYSKFLRRNNEYSKSLEVLELLNPSQFKIQIEKVFCYIELGYWYQAIELCETLLKENTDHASVQLFLERARIYTYKQVGQIPRIDREFTYVEKQIYDYSDVRALYYIYGADEFSEITELKTMLEKLKNVLQESKCVPMPSVMLDKYLFENIDGRVLKVETVHNTQDIVFLNYVDQYLGYKDRVLNAHLLCDDNTLEFGVSQTEKFYQKYKNMV